MQGYTAVMNKKGKEGSGMLLSVWDLDLVELWIIRDFQVELVTADTVGYDRYRSAAT